MKTIHVNDNYADIFKTFKQQLQNINLNEEERKKKKLHEKKEKMMKDSEKTRKLNLEHLKQQMQKKIEGKNLNLKKKFSSTKNVLTEQDLLK